MRELLKNGQALFLRRQTNILSAALIIMATYALSHLMGFLKTWLLISNFFNRADVLDVYYAAQLIPETVFQLLVIGSLSAAFIPVFTRYLAKNESEAWDIASLALNAVFLVFFIVSLAIFIFASPLSHILAPGFNPLQLHTLTSLLRIMLLAQLFFSVSGFLTGVIQSHQRFLIPAIAPLTYNLGIIFGIIFLSPRFGIFGPAWGMVIGALFHMLVQLPLALKLGFKFTYKINFTHAGVREIMRLMPPRALALGIDQIEQFVAVSLASLLSAGSLSMFNVAKMLYLLPTSLFGVSIGQAALPALSRVGTPAEQKSFHKIFLDSLLQVAFMALPVSTLFIVLRIPLVRLVFGAPSFPWSATLLTGKTLAILSFSAGASAIAQLIIRGFYALHDTRTPLYVGLIAAVFSSVICYLSVIYYHWGILGLAFSLSLTSILETAALLYLINRRFHRGFAADFQALSALAKMIFASFVMGISLWLPMRLLDQFVFDTTRTLPLIALTLITCVIGFSVYLSLSYLFRIDELFSFIALLQRASSWNRHLFPPRQPVVSEPVLAPTKEDS